MISRNHATISQHYNVWKLKDNNSVNGVFVNNKKVHEVILNDGDIIVFGGGGNRPFGSLFLNDSEFRYIFKISPMENEPGFESEEETTVSSNSQNRIKREREDTNEINLNEDLNENLTQIISENSSKKQIKDPIQCSNVSQDQFSFNFINSENPFFTIYNDPSVLDEKKNQLLKLQQNLKSVRESSFFTSNFSEPSIVCSLCHDIMEKPICIPCGHFFCIDCIDCWTYESISCPVCKKLILAYENIIHEESKNKIYPILTSLNSNDFKKWISRSRTRSKDLKKSKLELNIFVAQIRERIFLNINDSWNIQERNIFSKGIRNYYNSCKSKYYSLVGLTTIWIENASYFSLINACSNIGLLLSSVFSPETYKTSNIKNFEADLRSALKKQIE